TDTRDVPGAWADWAHRANAPVNLPRVIGATGAGFSAEWGFRYCCGMGSTRASETRPLESSLSATRSASAWFLKPPSMTRYVYEPSAVVVMIHDFMCVRRMSCSVRMRARSLNRYVPTDRQKRACSAGAGVTSVSGVTTSGGGAGAGGASGTAGMA